MGAKSKEGGLNRGVGAKSRTYGTDEFSIPYVLSIDIYGDHVLVPLFSELLRKVITGKEYSWHANTELCFRTCRKNWRLGRATVGKIFHLYRYVYSNDPSGFEAEKDELHCISFKRHTPKSFTNFCQYCTVKFKFKTVESSKVFPNLDILIILIHLSYHNLPSRMGQIIFSLSSKYIEVRKNGRVGVMKLHKSLIPRYQYNFFKRF